MAMTDQITDLVLPLVEPLGLSLYDVELNGGVLRITVDRPGGVDLEALAEVTRLVSRTLDVDDPMPGRYTLEVSSPGLERRLRTRQHFDGAVGEVVNVKLAPHADGDRRARGELRAVGETTITVATADGDRAIALDDITKATTVFEWGPSPKPGSTRSSKRDRAAGAGPNDPERRAAAR